MPPRDANKAAALRTRVFDRVAYAATRHPRFVLGIALAVITVCALQIPGLRVSTSRHGLVADDDPYQARQARFLAEFGLPDTPFIVVHGGTADDRRLTIDALAAGLEQLPGLRGQVLGRIGPAEIAEVLLLQSPQLLSAATTLNGEAATLSEQGLAGLFDHSAKRLDAWASVLQVQALNPLGAAAVAQRTQDTLEGLAQYTQLAEQVLRGEAPAQALAAPSAETTFVDRYGYLIGDGGAFHLLLMFPKLPDDEVTTLQPFVEQIRAVRDATLARLDKPDVTARVTGIPALAVDESAIINNGLWQSSVASTLAIIALLYLGFRSIRQVLLAFIPMAVGAVVTVAAARWLYGDLNIITSSFISILLGLGIDFSVHALTRYNEFRRGGMESLTAVGATLQASGPAILTGATTTALAFLAIRTTRFTAFGELGVITALGLVVMVAATYFVLPPLLTLTRRWEAGAPPSLPGLYLLQRVLTPAPRLLLGVALLLAGAGAWAWAHITFNSRHFDFLPQHAESALALKQMEASGGMSPLFATLTADDIEDARRKADAARALPEVGMVQGPADLLPPLDSDLRDALARLTRVTSPDFTRFAAAAVTGAGLAERLGPMRAAVERLVFVLRLTGRPPQAGVDALKGLASLERQLSATPTERMQALQATLARVGARAWQTAAAVAERGAYSAADLPPVMRRRFASHNEQRFAVYVFPKGSVWDAAFSERLKNKLEAIDPSASGVAISTHVHTEMIRSGFRYAAWLAAVLVVLLVFMDFRRLDLTLLALLPLGVGWLWMGAGMAAFGVTLNVANIVALPLILGIGVDTGVHLVHRCREAWQQGEAADLKTVFEGTGGAVLLSAVTTVAGFACLMIADYGAMKSLGLTMVIGVNACLLASLIVLPALLLVLGRVRVDRSRPSI